MDFSKCDLYGINRKRDLSKILKFNYKDIEYFNLMYKPYIENKQKKRLVEPPNEELKNIQKRIKRKLDQLEISSNVFSGIIGRSYIDNAIYHLNSDYFVKMDISKFFPNIHREKVYNFFKNEMKMSSDVADIITNLSTINLKLISNLKVFEYINLYDIKSLNHLPTGSPISSILSYLVNKNMFDKLDELAQKNRCIVSFYVDDIIFSSKSKINKSIISQACKIIRYNQVDINISKTKTYKKEEFKKVTGCVIKDGKLYIPNKTRYKIKKSLLHSSYSSSEINKIMGLINCARVFDQNKYKNLLNKIKLKRNSNQLNMVN